MASTYENDLRLEEMATGENSGSWGTKTNTNLELVADAFSYGTETIADADTAITIADGAADAARSLALKISSSEDLTTTRVITLGPNTTSKVWIIENNTSGDQVLTISAGSGTNITLANGTTKIIATDGIGAGSNVVELYTNLHNITIDGVLSLADGSNSAPSLTNTGDLNTGLYFPAADEVGLTVGGTQRLNVSATGIDVTGDLTVDTDTLFVDSSTNKVSIGTTSSDGTLHVHTGSAGTITAGAAANDLVIESDNAVGMTLLFDDTNTNAYGSIYFGNETDGNADGRINYFGSTYVTTGDRQAMVFRAGNVERMRLQSGAVFNEGGVDSDFRVESDSYSSMLKVDAGLNYVGIGNAGNLGGQLNILGTTGIRGQGSGGYKTASMIRPTAFGYSTGSYAVTMLGDANTQGTVSIGYDPSSNTSGAFTGTGGEILFRNEMQFLTPNSADDAFLQHFKLGDSGTVFNDTSKNLDFRVESDGNTHMLFVDGGNNRIGINDPSPQQKFSIVGGGSSSSTLELSGSTNDSSINDNSSISSPFSLIVNVNNQRAGNQTGRTFTIRDGGQGYQGGTEIARFGLTESVINESGNNQDFRVESDSNANMLFVDAGQNNVGIGKAPGSGQGALQIAPQVAATNYYRPAGNYAVFGDSGGNGEHDWVYLSGSYTDTGKSVGFAMQDYNGNFGNYAGSYIRTNQAKVRIGHFVGGANSGAAPSLADNFIFDTAGGAVFNERGENGDFRVESDGNANMLFVDGGANKVSVGTGSPQGVFTVQHSLNNTSDWWTNSQGSLYLQNLTAHTVIKFNNETGYDSKIVYNSSTSTGFSLFDRTSLQTSFQVYSNAIVLNEDGADRDFRVESDTNTHALFVDGGSSKVGIGSNSPATNNASVSGLTLGQGGGSAMLMMNVNGGGGLYAGTDIANSPNNGFRMGHLNGTNRLELSCNNNNSFASGVVLSAGGTSWGTFSDERRKTDLVEISDGLDKVATLRAVTGRYTYDDATVRRPMLIAQDVQAVLPEAVGNQTASMDDPTEYLTLNYTETIPLLVSALKDAKQIIEALEARITALENA